FPPVGDPGPTIERWRVWAHQCPAENCPFSGPWHDLVVRASLTLKTLMVPYSGAISESVTTSIPVSIGSSRTWDLRYAWLTDAPRVIRVTCMLGDMSACDRYFGWICDLLERDAPEKLQSVYTLDGGRHLPEHELNFLSGYRDSRPVRIGNEAARL